MSVAYRAVGWNPQKRRYDLILGALVLALLVLLVGGGALRATERDDRDAADPRARPRPRSCCCT